MIGERRDLVGASDKRVDLHTISGRPIQILLLHHLNPDSELESETRVAGFYNPESANKHQLLVISLNDTRRQGRYEKSQFSYRPL